MWQLATILYEIKFATVTMATEKDGSSFKAKAILQHYPTRDPAKKEQVLINSRRVTVFTILIT